MPFHHVAFGVYEAHVTVERTGGSQLEVGSDRDMVLIGFVHQCPFHRIYVLQGFQGSNVCLYLIYKLFRLIDR